MPVPGASNINFGQRVRTPLNLAPEPPGALVKAPSQALIPINQPSTLPTEIPRPPVNFTNLEPLPDLTKLKPPTNVIPEPPPKPQAPTLKIPALPTDLPKIPPEVKAGVAVGSTLINPGTAANPIVPLKLGHAAVQIWAHNAHELLKLWQLSQPESKPEDLDLNEGEGKGDGIPYLVDYHVHIDYGDGRIEDLDGQQGVWGPVEAIRWFNSPGSSQTQILSKGRLGAPYRSGPSIPPLAELDWVDGSPSYAGPQPATVTLTKIQQLDQQGNPVPTTPTDPRPQPQPQRIPSLSPQPINTNPNQPQPQKQLNNFPERPPFAEPEPEFKKPPIKFAIPSDKPIQISSPGQPTIQVAPTPTGQPQKQPTIINIPTGTPGGQPQPVQVISPGGNPTTFTAPGGAPVTINIPGFKPVTYTPGQGQPENTIRPIQQPDTLVPEAIAQPAIPIQKIKPIGDPPAGLEAQSRPKTPVTPETTGTNSKGQPVTFTPVIPATKPTPTTTLTPTTPEQDPAKGFIPAPDAATVVLTGLTPFLQQIISQTSTPAIASAVCSTTKPGGCSSNMANDAANNAVNQAKDDILGKLSDLANLALLPKIDAKLGPQIAGGLSGGMGRLSRFLGIDRVFNLINLAANLHNALMLSNSLKVTLLEMLSSVGNATGLLETSEGDNVDLNSVFDRGVEQFMIFVLGEENYAGLKVQWRKHNRIYQAAANSINMVTSMFNSLANAVEVGAEYTGRVGNALKAAGQVYENAYAWMAEKIDARISPFMRFQRSVGGVSEIMDAITEVAESVVEGHASAAELQKSNTEFVNALAAVQRDPGKDNLAVAEEVKKQRENATKDPTGEDEQGLLSFLTD